MENRESIKIRVFEKQEDKYIVIKQNDIKIRVQIFIDESGINYVCYTPRDIEEGKEYEFLEVGHTKFGIKLKMLSHNFKEKN